MIKKLGLNLISILMVFIINALVFGAACYLLGYKTMDVYKDVLLYSSDIYLVLFLFTISGSAYSLRGSAMYSHILSINNEGREKAVNDFSEANYKKLGFPIKMLCVALLNILVGIMI